MIRIQLGKYIEIAIEWLSEHLAPVFDTISAIIDNMVTGFQEGLIFIPAPILIIFVTALAYYLTTANVKRFSKQGWRKGKNMMFFSLVGLLLVNSMNLWQETLETFALVLTSAILALLIGIPLGIYTSRNDNFEKVIRPALDLMQTMPPFVYLIPAILFFSVGNVPGVVATVVFALPPAVRLTNLGIRGVQKEVVEASTSFGSTKKQLLFKVQIPLAKPTILAGVNQVIMLSLSMVVIASMVGASGLGQEVYKGILRADLALGFEAGLGIVILAIILDRLTQALGSISGNTSKKDK